MKGERPVSWCSHSWWRLAVAPVVVFAFALMAGGPAPAGAADNPASAYPKKNPLSGNQEAIKEGARLYFKWCVACHGPEADGKNTRFGSYGANLTNFWRGYPEFVVIVLNGKEGRIGRMPPWGGVLDEEQISEIGAFLETKASDKARWVGY
jgi:mono/diheme cytochrome c family protein